MRKTIYLVGLLFTNILYSQEGTEYYYHTNHLGSTAYLTDVNGEVVQHTEYLPYGQALVDEHVSTEKIPYLFNGKEYDEETGMYYYGARYYNPETAQWLGVDPPLFDEYLDGEKGQGGVYNSKNLSPYSYAFNNPLKYIDPDGMAPTLTIDGWSGFSSVEQGRIRTSFENINFAGNHGYRTGIYYPIEIGAGGEVSQDEIPSWRYPADRGAQILASLSFGIPGLAIVASTGRHVSEGSTFIGGLINSATEIEVTPDFASDASTEFGLLGPGIAELDWALNPSGSVNVVGGSGWSHEVQMEAEVQLFHELVHVRRIMDGVDEISVHGASNEQFVDLNVNRTVYDGTSSGATALGYIGVESVSVEEYETVGFNNTNPSAYTENNYRNWTGRAQRASYNSNYTAVPQEQNQAAGWLVGPYANPRTEL